MRLGVPCASMLLRQDDFLPLGGGSQILDA
jgi:hypothetical protein